MSKAPSMLNVVTRITKVLDELPIEKQRKCLEALALIIDDKESDDETEADDKPAADAKQPATPATPATPPKK